MKKLVMFMAVIISFIAATALVTDVNVLANKDAICDGIEVTGGSCAAGPAEDSVNNIVATVINIFSWIVGVVAVIFVIFGGFKYITSGGDSNKVSSAKNTILYAIVGLIIVALAQVIVVFVLNAAT